MAMVGHKTEAIYRRYAIVDAGALRDAAGKLDALATGTIQGHSRDPGGRNLCDLLRNLVARAGIEPATP